jgi:hypothetical protein
MMGGSGNSSSGPNNIMLLPVNTGTPQFVVTLNDQNFDVFGNTNARGNWAIDRPDGIQEYVYKNSADTNVSGQLSANTTARMTTSMYLTAWNNFGTANNSSGDTMGAAWIATASLQSGTLGVSTKICQIQNRINTYMIAYGFSIYSNPSC